MRRFLCIAAAVPIALFFGHGRDVLHGLAMCGAPMLILALWFLIARAMPEHR